MAKRAKKNGARHNGKRTIQMYKSYSFREKDPIIDVIRTIVQINATTSNHTINYELQAISDDTRVSVACMRGWFSGPTRRPQFATVVTVMRHFGVKRISLEGNRPEAES